MLAVCCPALAKSGTQVDTPNATIHLLTLEAYFEELLESTENCNNDTMLRAVEGVFLLQYRLQRYIIYLYNLSQVEAGPNPNTT